MKIGKEKIDNDIKAMIIHKKLGHNFGRDGVCEQCGFIANINDFYRKQLDYRQINNQKSKYNILVNYIYRIRNDFKLPNISNLLLLGEDEKETREFYNIIMNEKKITKYIENPNFKKTILEADLSYLNKLKTNKFIKEIYIKNKNYNEFIQYKLQDDEVLTDEEIELLNNVPNDFGEIKEIISGMVSLLSAIYSKRHMVTFITKKQVEKATNIAFLFTLRRLIDAMHSIVFNRQSKGYYLKESNNARNKSNRMIKDIDQRLYKLDKRIFDPVYISSVSFYPCHFTTEQLSEILTPLTESKMEYIPDIMEKNDIEIKLIPKKEVR